jgi:peroxidase
MRKKPYVMALLCTAILAINAGILKGQGSPQVTLLSEFRPIGGSGNNVSNPNLDVVPGAPEIALAPLNFAPGTNDGLVEAPNARVISNVISGGTGSKGQNAETTDPRLSAWLYVFGQFVDHDLDLEATPLTSEDISITAPPDDPVFPNAVIAMTRDTRSSVTNTIINTTAGYLDLSQLYGSDQATADSLRNSDGTLATSDNGLALPVVSNQFVTGDPRVMENPELTDLTILFMREHNFWVAKLKAQNPTWTGDQLYNMAKAITTAEYQNVVYQEYLPALIGPVLGPYTGYNPTVNSQVTQEFSTAAFRVGHSQVSDTQAGVDTTGKETFSESLADAFFNTPADDEANDHVNQLIRSLGTDFSQATDVYAVAALRNLLVAGLVGGEVDRMDLMAIDIQREKDVGLASLNQTRVTLGLRPYGSFKQLTSDPQLQKNFQSVYGSIDRVDLFMGGLAEAHAPGANVGQTFQLIIAKQFAALRAGDRFFWLRQGFDRRTALTILTTQLSDIVKRNAATPNLQRNVFIQADLPQSSPKPRLPLPSPVNGRGHRFPLFLSDGN